MNTLKLSNIKLKDYRNFLTKIGLKLDHTRGGHEYWQRKDLVRLVTFSNHIEPIPEIVINYNNKTLRLSRKEFEKLFFKIK